MAHEESGHAVHNRLDLIVLSGRENRSPLRICSVRTFQREPRLVCALVP